MGPASTARRPPSSTSRRTAALAPSSSPAMNTSSGWPPTWPSARVPANVVLNALTTFAPGDLLRDLLCRRAGLDRQRLEGLRVDRVDDVDDHLAVQLVAVATEDIVERLVPDGEHDDVAVQRVVGPGRAYIAGQLARERLGLCVWVPTTVTVWPPARARVAMPRAILPVPTIVMSMRRLCLSGAVLRRHPARRARAHDAPRRRAAFLSGGSGGRETRSSTSRSAGPGAAEVDAGYAAYDQHPLDEPDAWGDLASFRRAAAAS